MKKGGMENQPTMIKQKILKKLTNLVIYKCCLMLHHHSHLWCYLNQPAASPWVRCVCLCAKSQLSSFKTVVARQTERKTDVTLTDRQADRQAERQTP